MVEQNKSPELSALRKAADCGSFSEFLQFRGNSVAHRAAVQANQGRNPLHKPLSTIQKRELLVRLKGMVKFLEEEMKCKK